LKEEIVKTIKGVSSYAKTSAVAQAMADMMADKRKVVRRAPFDKLPNIL